MRVLNHLVCFGTLAVVALLAMAAGAYGEESMDVRIERKTCLAEDGVLIVYSAAGALKQMVRMLFHADADPALIAEAESRMGRTSPEAAHDMFMSFAGYDVGDAASRLTVPLRAINGERSPRQARIRDAGTVSMVKSIDVLGHPATHVERAAQAFCHTFSVGCC